jgi:hypothetical protein
MTPAGRSGGRAKAGRQPRGRPDLQTLPVIAFALPANTVVGRAPVFFDATMVNIVVALARTTTIIVEGHDRHELQGLQVAGGHCLPTTRPPWSHRRGRDGGQVRRDDQRERHGADRGRHDVRGNYSDADRCHPVAGDGSHRLWLRHALDMRRRRSPRVLRERRRTAAANDLGTQARSLAVSPRLFLLVLVLPCRQERRATGGTTISSAIAVSVSAGWRCAASAPKNGLARGRRQEAGAGSREPSWAGRGCPRAARGAGDSPVGQKSVPEERATRRRTLRQQAPPPLFYPGRHSPPR